MKYIKSLLCIILVAVLLSGCSFRLASSVNDLISAISPFGDNADIKLAMDNYLGNGYSLKNPTSGDYITSYNFYDLDGDGENEAIAFYETEDSLGVAKMALLKKENEKKWQVLASVDGNGESAYRLDFSDIDNDSNVEVIVCWNSISNSTSHSFVIYEVDLDDKPQFEKIGDAKTVNNYSIGDFIGNGTNQLLLFEILSGTKNSAKAELYRIDGGYSLIGETRLDSRVLSYNNISQEKTSSGIRVYADAISSSGNTEFTEVLYYSDMYSSIVSPFYSYSSGTTSGTSRSCLINSMDINSDGTPEIPTDADYDAFPTDIYSLDWKAYRNTVLVHTAYSLFVKNDGYTVVIPDKYLDKIKVEYNKEERELSVYSSVDNQFSFSVKPVLKAVYDEKSFDSYSVVCEENGYYYLAKTSDNENIKVSLDDLKQFIKIC